MNARAGDNSQFKLSVTLVKMLSISVTKADTLLKHILCDTADDMTSMDKLNCAEDCHIGWTAFQNLDPWFNSWENFLVKFGFTNHNAMVSLCLRMVQCVKSYTWMRLVSCLMRAM